VAYVFLQVFNASAADLMPPGNQLLDSLPDAVKQPLRDDFETVSLARGQSLMRQGEPARYVYFPAGCLISVVAGLESGESVETATVGREGFYDVCGLFGVPAAGTAAIVQIPGPALRIEMTTLWTRLADPRLREALGPYAAWLIGVMTQSSACFAHHQVTERLARWLLMARDGIGQDELPLTQEFLAMMIGAQRPTVTLSIQALESGGMIEHRRGVVQIIDSEALEDATCECYALAKHRHDFIP
jgi:CRP-like cAMP-binding protein